MTDGPEQPSRGSEAASQSSPSAVDPHTPVDYPPNPGLPPPYPPPYAGGYAYGPDPYDPYRPTKPYGTNGKAIAALVTSLAGLTFCGVPSIIGLIIGIIAMRETRRTGQDGYRLALVAVIIGGLVAVGILLYLLLMVALFVSDYSAV